MPETLRRVGRYEIVREVGRGGMAAVYLARQTDLDRDVALKELGAFYASDESLAERFVRESRVAGSFNHANIVTVYEFFQHERVPYIAMEYLERGSLRPLVGKLRLAQIAGVLEGLLAGLAHAAKRHIVHRDLKPENLMISTEGTIKIADFGIAKALTGATARLTATGTAIGTPVYMAPEQVLGSGVTMATDLYSTGVIAFELLSGQVPFDHEETLALLYRHVNEPPPDLRSIRPDVAPELAEWVNWLLAKSPDERPASPSRAWDALEEIVIQLLGARWRRDSRLLTDGEFGELMPATPVPAEFPKTTPSGYDRPAQTKPATPEPVEVPQPLPTPREARRAEAPAVAAPSAGRWRGRRGLLLGAAAVLVLAAAGVSVAMLAGGGTDSTSTPPPADRIVPAAARFAVAGSGSGQETLFASAPGGTIVRYAGDGLSSSASLSDASGPQGLAAAADAAYVLDNQAIFRLDPTSLAPLGALDFSAPVAIAATPSANGAVAVRRAQGGGRLCRVQTSSDCVSLPFLPAGVGTDGSTFYVTNSTGKTLRSYVLRGGELSESREFPLGRLPAQGNPVVSASTLYVPVKRGVTVLDTKTSRTRQIALPTTPVSLAPAGNDRLVAALYSSNAVALIDVTKGTSRLVRPVERPVAVTRAARAQTVYIIGAAGAVVGYDPLTAKVVPGARGQVPTGTAATPRLSKATVSVAQRKVTVRLPFTGDSRSVVVRDLAIGDGRAAFEILSGGLVVALSARGAVERSGLTVRVESSPGGATVRLAASADAFTRLSTPVVRGGAIQFTATKAASPSPPPPVSPPPPPPPAPPPPPPPITIG